MEIMGITVEEMFWLLLLLAICSYTDIRTRELSIKTMLIFGCIGVFLLLREASVTGFYIPTGMFVGIGVFVISRVSKGAIGEGDAILLTVTGVILSVREMIILITIASFLAGMFGVLLMICKRADRKKELPFVPFLFISYIGMVMV